MRWNLKRLTATVAMFYGLITLVTAGWAYYLEQNWYQGEWQSAAAIQQQVGRVIRESGVKSGELNQLLTQMNIAMDWSGSYLTEAGMGDGQILATTTPRLLDHTWSEMDQVFRMSDYYWRGSIRQTFEGPDGKQYTLWALLDRKSIAWPVLKQIALVTAAAAWLAIATCLALDVRDRTGASGRAWFLLGLLTGPVGAAIWLVARSGGAGWAGGLVGGGGADGARLPSGVLGAPPRWPWASLAPGSGPAPAHACPGCGHTPPDGAAFCPRCGFALKPICPECKHTVALDWDYCTRCGAPLLDQPPAAAEGSCVR